MLQTPKPRSKKGLEGFCRHFWRTHGRRAIDNPEVLAVSVREYYNIRDELSLGDVRRLAL
jgi:hypothetical protein